ncbi:MAG TPA: hypothetical protein VGV61_19175 [Thermoanaerobaculia bacterium]|nr:hypothetical protein [Thermoanaerobaculia bacterium]
MALIAAGAGRMYAAGMAVAAFMPAQLTAAQKLLDLVDALEKL